MSIASTLSGPFIDKRHPYHILVVDPNKRLADRIKNGFSADVRIDRTATIDSALQMIGLTNYSLLILQLKLPLFRGVELAHQLKKLKPNIPVLSVSPVGMEAEATEIYRLGYPPPVQFPGGEDELMVRCSEYISTEEWHRRIDRLRNELKKRFGFNEILSMNPEMEEVHEKLVRIVQSHVPVLITGESGTGKELVARMIYRTSDRFRRPFVVVNCAAVPESLLESQFFGHEKGAFTGAVSRMTGKFELANNGTLFLDEIGDMSTALQAKFLRVIEYGEFERVGGNETLKVDVRLITATNRDLEEMVDDNRFRMDLYYRINVFPVHLPPLRQRNEDVNLLAYHFLKKAGLHHNRQVRFITPEAIDVLQHYSWPGNIRELENAVERALLLSDGVRLKAEDFPHQHDWYRQHLEDETDEAPGSAEEIRPLKDVERDTIMRALEATKGNVSHAARKLGIGRGTLHNKIKEHKLEY